MRKQDGNALFLILIAVALFGALSYAITQSSRSGGNIEREKQMIDQAVSEQCSTAVDYAVNTLKIFNGCDSGEINYEIDDTESSDKSCHVFDPEGAGATPCGAYLDEDDSCDMDALEIGDKCPDADIVYAGTSGGNRIYTTAADMSGLYSWNSGVYNFPVTGATSNSDGKANTDILVALEDAGAPYDAANACRGLGQEWYLPASNELNLLYTNRAAIGGFNTSGDPWVGWYHTSSENTDRYIKQQIFSNGYQGQTSKEEETAIRCVRR